METTKALVVYPYKVRKPGSHAVGIVIPAGIARHVEVSSLADLQSKYAGELTIKRAYDGGMRIERRMIVASHGAAHQNAIMLRDHTRHALGLRASVFMSKACKPTEFKHLFHWC